MAELVERECLFRVVSFIPYRQFVFAQWIAGGYDYWNILEVAWHLFASKRNFG